VVDVPYLLATRVPEALPLPHAAFCGLGAIAMHAFRVARLSLGEVAVVIGLGMLGNLIAQYSRIAGCRVVATDLAQSLAQIARSVRIEVAPSWDSLVDQTKDFSSGNGADAVFLAVNRCTDEMLQRATELLRLRGRLVIVGTADAQLPREALFAREAELIVSRAGGPGRYDSNYEAGCVDYPYGYVRWTEGRNVAEYVRLAADGSLQVAPLLTDLVPIREFAKIYESLSRNSVKHLGVVFDWREEEF
jgi:threonine dehydrogenase-like Zn-dependent dehydrogenase